MRQKSRIRYNNKQMRGIFDVFSFFLENVKIRQKHGFFYLNINVIELESINVTGR